MVSENQINSYDFWFLVRKCNDNTCNTVTPTYGYLYIVNLGYGNSYVHSGVYKNENSVLFTKFTFVPVWSDSNPFAVTGLYLVVSEPGTYVVYIFAPYSERYKTEPTDYYEKIIITINEKDDFLTCSSLANNGYFRAFLDEVDTSSSPYSLKFEHVEGQEESWIENRSRQSLNFRLDDEWSYLPKRIKVSDLICSFEALSDAGQPENGQCNADNIFLPPYTRATITGGTISLYDDLAPGEEYRIAYARRETYNISHLFISIEESRNALRDEPVVYALPEDEIGAYVEGPDGEREYLIFQTYDICMAYLGSEDLCRGNERCFHK